MPYDSVFRRGLFAGQIIVVTGGGSGIGRCTAHELTSLGATVVLLGRTEERLRRVAAEIAEDGGRADWQRCDIRDEDGVRTTVADILTRHGRIDALINNAGGQFSAMLADISKKGWDAIIANNLTGGFVMAREVFNQAMKAWGGAIVNVVAVVQPPMPMLNHTAAARAAMITLTEAAALEWAPCGVRVNAVAPGLTASSGLATYPAEVQAMMSARRRSVPMQRAATEAEISAAIVFLLSPASRYMTGETLIIDGGARLVRHYWPLAPHDRLPPYQGFHRYEPPPFIWESVGEGRSGSHGDATSQSERTDHGST
jgi:citronellol/citronellal dehydrogenase